MKTVIVLGTARSGTSMIGGIVHRLGVDMNPIDNPSAQNPKGSYEDNFLISCTSEIYVQQGKGSVSQELVDQFNDYLKNRMKSGKDWGFKSALTHEIWSHIDQSIFEDLYLIANFRSALMNAKSWLVHLKDHYGDQNKTIEDGILRIQQSNAVVLDVMRNTNHKKLFTCYEEVKNNPDKIIADIANFIGVETISNDEFIMPQYSTLSK